MKRIHVLTLPILLAVSCLYLQGCFIFEVNLKGEFVEEKDFTIPAEGIATIDALTTNGNIVVDFMDTKLIKVHARKKIKAKTDELAEEYASDVVIHAEAQGDVAKVYYKHPKGWKKVQIEITYAIDCPKNLKALMNATNGSIHLNNPENTVDAGTTNGNIQLKGGRDAIELRTTNGAVNASECQGEITASTTNGKISVDIASLQKEARFTSTNGGINATIHSGVAPVQLSTTNGSATLGLPADFSGQLDASTFNGSISSDFAIPVQKPSKKHLSGPIGEGGEATVKIRTTNGSIKIKKIEQ